MSFDQQAPLILIDFFPNLPFPAQPLDPVHGRIDGLQAISVRGPVRSRPGRDPSALNSVPIEGKANPAALEQAIAVKALVELHKIYRGGPIADLAPTRTGAAQQQYHSQSHDGKQNIFQESVFLTFLVRRTSTQFTP